MMPSPRTPLLLKVAPGKLITFCKRLITKGILITHCDPIQVASVFRRYFKLPCPLNWETTMAIFLPLGNLDVKVIPLFEQKLGIRGHWDMTPEGIIIRVTARARPIPSRLKTFLHELFELMAEISMSLSASVPDWKSDRHREETASRFAAAVRMPPEQFVPAADSCSFDIVDLTNQFDETIAGVARQLRDLNAAGMPFYMVRCHFERAPERRCPKLMATLDASGGVAVRVEDVVHTPLVFRKRPRGWQDGPLPAYNLPGMFQWRVMPHEIKNAFTNGHSLFLPGLRGAAGFEGVRNRDLLGEYDLSALVVPFDKGQERGVFVVGIHPDHAGKLAKQVARMTCITRNDISWLFSWASDKARRPRTDLVAQSVSLHDPKGNSRNLVLSCYDEDGFPIESMDEWDYSVVHQIPDRKKWRRPTGEQLRATKRSRRKAGK